MLIIGHRGAPNLAHENTIDSFEKAFKNNVDGIELDVQLTKDNKLAVFHDFHTFALNGHNQLIKDILYKDLQKISKRITIPTLDEVLKYLPANKELHIEIKSNQINNNIIVDKVLKSVSKKNINKNCIISSFNPFVLSAIKKKAPLQKVGLLWTRSIGCSWFITHYSYYKVKPYSFHANINYFNHEIEHWVQRKGLKLYFYTVNNSRELIKAKEYQADGIFTDYPNIDLSSK